MNILILSKGSFFRIRKQSIAVVSIFIFLLVLAACSVPKKVFYFNEPTPPHLWCEKASQESVDYPPFLRPEGKRQAIFTLSQYFTLAIPNAIDKSGRAQDLQQSLADMLYTTLFTKGRFNLLDRRELVEIDPEWLASSLKRSLSDLSKEDDRKTQKSNEKSERVHKSTNAIDQAFEYLKRRQENIKQVQKVLEQADGILLVYITSRIGTKKGGSFFVDYRIVNQQKRLPNRANEIVLFAGSQEVEYRSSTTQEVEFDRDDIVEIAENINRVFPHPHKIKKAQIVKRDNLVIVIDIGRDDHIIPGLYGYVVHLDDSIRIELNKKPGEKTQHYTYLAEFIITEVFDKTSTGLLLYPPYIKDEFRKNFEWDIRVGDDVVIK